jgi:hypothetical protein
MFTILEVAIGLIFVYLLGSLICSAVNEWIARLLNTRAKDLENRITAILNDPGLVDNLYNHPLIRCFTRRTFLDKLFRRTSIPSYIDSKIFSTALAETLIKSGSTTEIETSKDVSNFKIRMLLGLEKGIDKLEKDIAKDTLNSIIDMAKTKIDKIEDAITKIGQELEQWFNSAMEQLSKWYKQKTRIILFVIAFSVSGIFNIDTIMITKNLYQDQGLRNEVVKAAEAIAGKEYTDPAVERKMEDLKNRIKDLKKQLDELNLIGWDTSKTTAEDSQGLPKGIPEIIYKIIGIFITSLAVSMGAPFWFDLLKKAVGFKKMIQPSKKEGSQ